MFLQMDFKKRAENKKNFSEFRWNIEEEEEKKINISFTYFLIKIHIFRKKNFLCWESERRS